MSDILQLTNIALMNESGYRLKNININIRAGEKVALIGKSGSGKSTLINIANGTITPKKGKVFFNGRDLAFLSVKQKSRIGTLWQDLRLLNELSVGQNINTGALGRKSIIWSIANLITTIEKDECIACLRAMYLSSDLLHKNVQDLSYGQQTRVAIARLLRQHCNLMLIDEPFANIDPTLSVKILKMLLNEQKNNALSISSTCIISIHQPKLINHFSRVIGLKNGEIYIDSPTSEVMNSQLEKLYN